MFILQKFAWYDKDQDMVELYVEYLTSLLSAQVHYLHSVLSSLIRLLWVVPSLATESRDEGDGVEKTLENIHMAIQAVLRLVPTATAILMPLVRKTYPYKGKSTEIQVILHVGVHKLFYHSIV